MRSQPISSLPRQIRPGRSLVELVCVLAIMAVVAAATVPRWSTSLQLTQVDRGANRIVADLARAQAAAYNASGSRTVTFTVSASQYALAGIADPNHPATTYTVKLGDSPYSCRLVSVDLQGSQQITFNRFGYPDRGGTIIVAVGSVQRTIVVDSITGKGAIQ